MITVGVDVGGTKVLGVIIDTARPGEVLASQRVPTPDGGAGLIDTILDLHRVLSVGHAVEALGVGVPGLVDVAGRLHVGPHLHRIADLPLGRLLAEGCGVPVVVDNDANCHAVAEQRAGRAVGDEHVLVVTLGTGIGAGIISAGRLVHGAHGFAGEPGHVVVDPNGPPCPCGQRGCWERFASGTGLGRLARDAALGGRLDAAVALAGGDPQLVQGEHVTAAARDGDAGCLAVLDDFAWWIAFGLANLVNVLDPARIVIGGGIVEDADLVLPPVRHHFQALVMAGDRRPRIPIEPAALGEQAGAIGAALLPLRP